MFAVAVDVSHNHSVMLMKNDFASGCLFVIKLLMSSKIGIVKSGPAFISANRILSADTHLRTDRSDRSSAMQSIRFSMCHRVLSEARH